ncbi:MAG: signal peptidase II [Spirochaetaceae bacterium]|jgi:signal peptidase II|nr:signal peptidase II [Spirochaetaceae bacterium]
MAASNTGVLKKALPFSLTVLIVLADQITKAYIADNWPIGTMITDVFNNDLLRIYHVRNKVIAFSLGTGLPETVRPLLFIILPVAVLGFLCFFYWKSDEFAPLQRWAIAGIVGGGVGNLIDRVFRPEGVVDFISVKFFGIFGFERWPTFNVADSSVVVCVLIWLVSMFFKPSDCGASGGEKTEAA